MGVPGAPAPMMAAQGTPANIQDQIAHMNRPLDENASLEERRAEVKRRIAEAQRLRLSLQQNGAAGLPEAAGRPVADSASPMPTLNVPAAPQQSRAPANVVGYPKKNKYDADSEGKIKVPPGTEILTTLMKKGISDYTGTSLKAIANRDVYDITRQYVIFPKGTEFNIKMVRTRNVNEAISNRVGFLVKEGVLPNGNSIDFSTASVGDREGVGAIEDQTDYHLIPQFLGVAAYALIGSRTSRTGTGEDEGSYAGDVGENSRSQFAPLAEKYLNIVPTQTIRPDKAFKLSQNKKCTSNHTRIFMLNTLIKALLIAVMMPALAFAKDETPIAMDPLAVWVRTVYPEDVQTVGEAIRYLLEPTGYTVVVAYPAPSDAISIVNSRVPAIARVHRTMPVMDAIQILIGNNNWIVVDRNHKLISFSEKKS